MPPLRALAVLLLVAAAATAVWMFSRPADIAPTADGPAANVATSPDEVATAKSASGRADASAPAEREVAATAQAVTANAIAGAAVFVGRVADEQGRPVANATVRSSDRRGMFTRRGPGRRAEPAAAPRSAPIETTTDANGAFRIAIGDLGESASLRIVARAFRVLDHTVQRPVAGETDLGTLTLKSGAVVSGRVVDANGTAIAGARVSRESPRPKPGEPGAMPGMPDFGDMDFDPAEFGDFDPSEAPMPDADAMEGDFGAPSFVRDMLSGSATTDGDGRFELAHCEAGAFSLRARHAEHPSARLEGLSVAAGAQLTDVVVTMAPGASIRGIVVGAPDTATKLRVLAAPVRSAPAMSPVETPFGDMSEAMGEMMNDFGGFAERSALVAEDRTFVVTGLQPGRPYRVWIGQRTADFGPNTACSVKVEVRPPTEGLEIRFDPGITVTFQVVDGKRAPIERLWVSDRLRGGGGMDDVMGMVPRSSRVASYPEGRVTLASLRPKKKQTLSLKIDAIGFASFERKDITLPAQGALDLGVIQLEATPSLEVAVRAKDTGEPIANAQVRVTANEAASRDMNPFARMGGAMDPGPRSARTDAKGLAVVNVVANGTFVVNVESQDFAPYASAPLAATAGRSLDVVLLRGGTVTAIVADVGSGPARIRHVTPSGQRDNKTTDRDGKVEFTHLEPGQHRFRLAERSGGFDMADIAAEFGGNRAVPDEPGWQIVDVADGGTAEVRFTRDPTATLRGVVRENGQPVARARVMFVQGSSKDDTAAPAEGLGAMMADFGGGGGGGGRTARTGDDGSFELKNLKAGAHRLRVTATNRAMPTVVDVTLVAGENVFDVALVAATVRGKVVAPDGAPVAGASVTVAAAVVAKAGADPMASAFEQMMPGVDVGAFAGNTRSVKTEADGSFELRGVQPNTPLQVRASAKPFAASASESFTVTANGAQDGITVKLLAAGKVKVTVTETAPFLSAQARRLGEDGEVDKSTPPVVQMLANGSGTLQGLRPGRWRVSLVRPAATGGLQTRDVDVTAGETATVAF